MSETRIEITGNIIVHHPVKAEPQYADWFNKEFDAAVEAEVRRFEQRGEAITFYREFEQRKAA